MMVHLEHAPSACGAMVGSVRLVAQTAGAISRQRLASLSGLDRLTDELEDRRDPRRVGILALELLLFRDDFGRDIEIELGDGFLRLEFS